MFCFCCYRYVVACTLVPSLRWWMRAWSSPLSSLSSLGQSARFLQRTTFLSHLFWCGKCNKALLSTGFFGCFRFEFFFFRLIPAPTLTFACNATAASSLCLINRMRLSVCEECLLCVRVFRLYLRPRCPFLLLHSAELECTSTGWLSVIHLM